MEIPSRGGNAGFQSGQLTLTGVSQQIPYPTSVNNLNTNLQMMVLHVTAPSHDVWVSSLNPTTSTGTTGGHRLVANTTWMYSATRMPLYVIGSNNDVLTYAWEWN